MVFGSHAKTRAMYSTPPCPSLAASTAAYRRRSFSDSQPKKRCIFPSISAAYTSMPYSLLQNLFRRKDTMVQAIREVIVDHILRIVYVAAVPYAHYKDHEPLIFNAANHPIIPNTISPESCKGGR